MKHKQPYIGFARVYDQIMLDVPYVQWSEYIKWIWSSHSFYPNTVLDLACGTGNMTLSFAREGYIASGIDMSAHMLEVARKKAREEGLFVPFTCQDMRNFTIDDPYDSVVCVFDSLNYLLNPSDVKSCFKSVYQALSPGGYFVFDMNTPLRLSTIGRDTNVFEGPWYFVVWRDCWDDKNQWWQVELTGFIKNNGRWQRFDEIHKERAFPISSVKEWLKEAGFTVKGVYEPITKKEASETTFRAYFAACKPK